MLRSIKIRLALFFVVLLFLPISIFAWTMNRSINRSFDTFAQRQQEQLLRQIYSQVSELYQPSVKAFDASGLEAVGNAALQNGVMLHLQSSVGELDWDISTHKTEECQLMLQHRQQNLHTRYPGLEGSSQQETFEILSDGKNVGTLTLGYIGPFSLNDVDVEFVSAMNRNLLTISICLLTLAGSAGLLLGIVIAKGVRTVSAAAGEISSGNYGVKIHRQFSTDELQRLVSSINEMSAALLEKERQKRQLTADVAHELRTPLSNLQAHMEAIIDGVWEPDSAFYQSCHEEILRLTEIIRQLTNLSSFENGSLVLRREQFHAVTFCRDLLSVYSLSARNAKIALCVDCPNDSLCYGDMMRLRECFDNLLTNAIRYTPPGGKIVIGYRECQESNCFTVSDTGIGIPAASLPAIFERFYRVDPSRSTKTGGLGIGLAITKAIIEAHGGFITAESEPGKGTKFTIHLPKQ